MFYHNFLHFEIYILYLKGEGEHMLLQAMDEIDLAMQTTTATDCNHIFLNFIPVVTLDLDFLVKETQDLVLKYGRRLWRMRITCAEVKFTLRNPNTGYDQPIRICLSSESGWSLETDVYEEVTDPEDGVIKFKMSKGISSAGYKPLSETYRISYDNMPIDTAYPTRNLVQVKRYLAQMNNTLYVYDLVGVIRQSVCKIWDIYRARNRITESGPEKDTLLHVEELIVDYDQDSKPLKVINRHIGQNKIGMVAWKMAVKTPDSPNGRFFYFVANDITTIQGSFGPKEDELYLKISQKAREEKVPLIYFAANSGARIGLVKEIQNCFQIAWKDPNNLNAGHEYIYLNQENYNKYRSLVSVEPLEVDGRIRYVIKSI